MIREAASMSQSEAASPYSSAAIALYMFTTAGFGLLAAMSARNLAQVGLLAILIMAPMVLLMGTCTPLGAAPASAR
jgi:ABC-2 type transport system permease protein